MNNQAKADILVVDDTPANLRLLVGMLTEQGYAARPVTSGPVALRAIAAAKPDLILLDINMPDMDGYTVCEQIKADPVTEDIPIIFISALDEISDKMRAFAVGGVDFITKPFQFREVLARVETHLSLHRLQRELAAKNAELAARAQELEIRNEELDAFAGMVAHDLRTALTPILGTARLMERMYAEQLDERGLNLLDRIASGGEQMVGIIEALLLLAKIRQDEPPMTTVDMRVVVAESLSRLEPVWLSYDAVVDVPDTWPSVIGYAPWLTEVWTNYVSNALKYGGRPPRVGLGATAVAPNRVRFWVQDNGGGISAEDQEKLFSPFVRLEEGKIEGHGLGLSIVKRIVTKLGGTVGIESENGQGSMFWFTLATA